MSMNNGINYRLSAAVSFEFSDTADLQKQVIAIMGRAQDELEALQRASPNFDVSTFHSESKREMRQLDYLSQFMTEAQIDELHNI